MCVCVRVFVPCDLDNKNKNKKDHVCSQDVILTTRKRTKCEEIEAYRTKKKNNKTKETEEYQTKKKFGFCWLTVVICGFWYFRAGLITILSLILLLFVIFKGNYDSYVQTRGELLENQMKRYKWEQDQISHMKVGGEQCPFLFTYSIHVSMSVP